MNYVRRTIATTVCQTDIILIRPERLPGSVVGGESQRSVGVTLSLQQTVVAMVRRTQFTGQFDWRDNVMPAERRTVLEALSLPRVGLGWFLLIIVNQGFG